MDKELRCAYCGNDCSFIRCNGGLCVGCHDMAYGPGLCPCLPDVKAKYKREGWFQDNAGIWSHPKKTQVSDGTWVDLKVVK